MKRILIAVLCCLPLVFTSPVHSQVSVQINIGDPAVRPWSDGVWMPGYYADEPHGRHHVWNAGRWRHDNGHHYGRNKGRGHSNRGNANGKSGHSDNGKGHGGRE